MCREESGLELPPLGSYATGLLFLDTATRQKAEMIFTDLARECGLEVSRSSRMWYRGKLHLIVMWCSKNDYTSPSLEPVTP